MSMSALREGSSWYRGGTIQPIEFIEANNMPFAEGNVIKYVTRHHRRNGAEDIHKAMHYLQLILELRYGEKKKTG